MTSTHTDGVEFAATHRDIPSVEAVDAAITDGTWTSGPRGLGSADPDAATHRAVSAAASIASGTAATRRVDPRIPTLAELRTAGMVPVAPVADPDRFQRAVASIARSAKLAETTRQLERATDIAVEKAVQLEEATRKIAELEATAERLADRVRVESMARTTAERELDTATSRATELMAALERATRITADRAIERDELRAALHRANQRAQTASDAADSYRQERDAARTTIDRIAGLIDPQD